ncbi:hypothetical protein AB0M45_22145 [Nocardia sp. NPDC051787]|uniref:hypothetical protein n=1 Tax=Nocardia sp. NPDC051787 TaxID=3155415 RepID=UPI003433A9DC
MAGVSGLTRDVIAARTQFNRSDDGTELSVGMPHDGGSPFVRYYAPARDRPLG